MLCANRPSLVFNVCPFYFILTKASNESVGFNMCMKCVSNLDKWDPRIVRLQSQEGVDDEALKPEPNQTKGLYYSANHTSTLQPIKSNPNITIKIVGKYFNQNTHQFKKSHCLAFFYWAVKNWKRNFFIPNSCPSNLETEVSISVNDTTSNQKLKKEVILFINPTDSSDSTSQENEYTHMF